MHPTTGWSGAPEPVAHKAQQEQVLQQTQECTKAMKVHEYQARQLLVEAGVPVPTSHVVETVDQAVEAFNAVAPSQKQCVSNVARFVERARVSSAASSR